MDKPMTLASHEYRDKYSRASRRVLSLSAGGSVVVRSADAGSAGWLRRRALTQYSGLLFSVLDGLRAGGSRIGTRSPRSFKGLGNVGGTASPIGRYGSDWLCRHLCDVADMAGLSNLYE
jgi:hypothetical protein